MSELNIKSLSKEELNNLIKSYDPNKIPANITLA